MTSSTVRTHDSNHRKTVISARKTAFLLAFLFVLPLLAHHPVDFTDHSTKQTSPRAVDPDVAITGINVTTPSFFDGSTNFLAPMVHTIRVTIINLGGSTGNGNISLQVNGAEEDRRPVSLPPGGQQNQVLYWDATSASGPGYTIVAIWDDAPADDDSDSTNDQQTISSITVSAVEEAQHLDDSLPEDGSKLARAEWAGSVTVRNSGNQQVSVTAALSLTSQSDSSFLQMTSSTVVVQPGSLSLPPEPENISISFDGGDLSGFYTLGGTLTVTGSGSPQIIDIPGRTVEFAALTAQLIPANSRNLDPGAETVLIFILQNSGSEGDNFTVTQENTTVAPEPFWAQSPAIMNDAADPLFVGSGDTVSIQVPLQVPENATLGESVMVTIRVQSLAAGYVLSGETVVIAGGYFEGVIQQDHGHASGTSFASLTPGDPITLDYTLLNNGTAPTQFEIFVAPTEPVPYWVISSPVTITDVVMPGDTRTIPVTIHTPSVVMPLDPNWKVNANQQVQLGIQAIPLEGGLTASILTTIIVNPVVELSIEMVEEVEDISVEDFLSGNTDRVAYFDVGMIHNLASTTSRAQVTLAPTGGTVPGVGVTLTPDISGKEHQRWSSNIPKSIMDLAPGETERGSATFSFTSNADYPYPAAGVFSFSFEATSDWGNFPGTIQENAEATISFQIEELFDAELIAGPTVSGDPSTAIAATMTLKNTGNDRNDFKILAYPKEGWEISLSKKAVNNQKSKINLWGLVGDNSDTTQFIVEATPPSTASADVTHEIWIYVNSTTTRDDDTKFTCEDRGGFWHVADGDCEETLAFAAAEYQLTENVQAELTPDNSTAVINRQGSTTLMLTLTNNGNSNKTFDLQIWNYNEETIQANFDDSFTAGGGVTLHKEVAVAAGAEAIIRIYTQAGLFARADEENKIEVSVSEANTTQEVCLANELTWVDTDTPYCEYDRSGIVIQVNPFHMINFYMNTEWTAVPGGSISVPMSLANLGNLLEVVNVTAQVPEGWNSSVNTSEISIEVGSENQEEATIIITLPPLEVGTQLSADSSYLIPIEVLNINEDLVVGIQNINVTILPVFAINVLESPDRIPVLPGSTSTADYEIQNAGNTEISISFSWSLEDSAGIGEQDRFGISINAGSNPLQLAIGESASLVVTVDPLRNDHWKDETAVLRISFDPVNAELDPIEFVTPIEIVRVHADVENQLDSDGPFDCGDRCSTISIPWVHVPTLSLVDASQTTYNLSVVGTPTRLVNFVQYPNTNWDFRFGEGANACQMGTTGEQPGIAFGSNVCSDGWDIGSVNPYEGGTINLQVIMPDKKSLAPGDGWDITLRLRNPAEDSEPNPSQFYTDFTVMIRVPYSADPLIDELEFSGTSLEASSTNITVVVINAGNAVMPTGVELSLYCSGDFARVTSPPVVEVPSLGVGGEFNHSWTVVTDPIPWFSTSEDFDCTASLSGLSGVFGNNQSNDVRNETLKVQSWGPPSPVLSVAGFPLPLPVVGFFGLAVLFGAISITRRAAETDSHKRLHASAYLAAAALGIISLSNPAPWFTTLAAFLAIVYAGAVSWLSSSELQTIHDDRKKARIGTRALLEDHDKEQANTFSELRWIISCAPYAFLPFVLLTPALSIDFGTSSLLALFAFLAFSPIVVHLMLRFLDSSYNRLYGSLAEIELRAIKIKRIIGTASSDRNSGSDSQRGGVQ